MRVTIGLTILVALSVSAIDSARADFALVELASNIGTTGGVNPMVGWEFKTNTAIEVTKLGFYDLAGDGLSTSHTLGIFDAASTALLASTTIGAGAVAPLEGPPVFLTPSNTTAIGAFRYVGIAPTLLSANHDYVVGATAAGYVDPTSSYQPFGGGGFLQTASAITFVQGRYTFFGPQIFGFPVNTFTNADFGPTFQFTVVPEPSTFALAATALAFAALAALRRKMLKT